MASSLCCSHASASFVTTQKWLEQRSGPNGSIVRADRACPVRPKDHRTTVHALHTTPRPVSSAKEQNETPPNKCLTACVALGVHARRIRRANLRLYVNDRVPVSMLSARIVSTGASNALHAPLSAIATQTSGKCSLVTATTIKKMEASPTKPCSTWTSGVCNCQPRYV